MILSGQEITKQVKKGHITIDPFYPDLVNPNSYNYRLGPAILEITDKVIDPKKLSNYKVIRLTDKGGNVNILVQILLIANVSNLIYLNLHSLHWIIVPYDCIIFS